MLSALYARLAAARRRWYARHPAARRRLARPVVSVGALAAGGRGKTPVTGLVAAMLRDAGERPAILSRGYRRTDRRADVVVVRDREAVRATVEAAGDEPLMLAERLPGVSVVVCRDRYRAGRLAETELGATVHLLDDGFQHVQLERDVDLLLAAASDLEAATFPGGRLRERAPAARVADAAIVDAADLPAAARVGAALGVDPVFRLVRTAAEARVWGGPTAGLAVPAGARVLAVCGIADPIRFHRTLAAAGLDLAGAAVFRDHQRFTPADVRRLAARAARLGAAYLVTTEKDLVRLAPHAPFDVAVAVVPLRVAIDPPDAFRSWLLGRVAAARSGR